MRPPRPVVPPAVAALGALVDDGVLEASEVVIADAVVRTAPGDAPPGEVTVAVALAALGRRLGFSCVDLDHALDLCRLAAPSDTIPRWTPPATADWTAALEASDLVQVVAGAEAVGAAPLVFDPALRRVWLARYAHIEATLCALVTARTSSAGGTPTGPSTARIDEAVARVFEVDARDPDDPQHTAVAVALGHRLSFLTGGPGTGKTWTAGRIIEAAKACHDGAFPLRVALAAPTGKAAARLRQAVGDEYPARTIHSLVGLRPGSAAPLVTPRKIPFDLVVVDEASMIDLPLMTRLLGAIPDSATVVVLGDPDQLLSVEVGSVLRDLVEAAADGTNADLQAAVTTLTRARRFVDTGPIATLAEAVRRGDADAALTLLRSGSDAAVTLTDPNDAAGLQAVQRTALDTFESVRAAAARGDATAAIERSRQHKILTATRRGPLGLEGWSDRLRRQAQPHHAEWFAGKGVIVTRNDRLGGLSNGDTGIVVADPSSNRPDGLVVAVDAPEGARLVPIARLGDHEDWWAMTIHKSQGSEFDEVVVSLPAEDAPILSRELLYTAVTRGRSRVRIVATEAALRRAVEHRVERASGVYDRLR